MENRISVGIVITTTIEGVRYALLQERGHFDPEKLPKIRQSWPGIYQVSAHGTVEAGDQDREAALLREIREELGSGVADEAAFRSDLIRHVTTAHRPNERAVTYTLEIEHSVLKSIPRGAFGLRLVPSQGADEIIGDASTLPDGKTFGAPDRGIWMFPDEREAVLKALGVWAV